MHPSDDAEPRLPSGTLEGRATRLAERERRRRNERFRWSLLGSTWVHMLLLLAFQCAPQSDEEEQAPEDVSDLLVLTLAPTPTARSIPETEQPDAGSALAALAERATVVRSDAEAALREADAIADALPADLSDTDRAMAVETSQEVGELLAATAPLADETVAAIELAQSDVNAAVAALTALSQQADALAQVAQALADDPTSDQVPTARLTAPAPTLQDVVDDALAALAPSSLESPGLAQGGAASEQEDAPAPPDNPPPTAADASAPTAAAAEEEAQEPEEVEPEPEPEPEAEDEVLLQKFIHSEEDVVVTTPETAEFISGKDADDDRTTRVDVTSEEQGEQTEWQEGQQTAPAAPSVQVERGEAADPAGQPEVAANEAEPTEGPQGGGQRGEQSGEGSRGEQGPTVNGGAAAAAAPSGADARVATGQARTAAAGRQGQVAVAGAAGTPDRGADGIVDAIAPDATEAPTGRDSGWWRPMAARVVMPTAPSTPPVAAPAEATASPTRSDSIAPVERPEELADEGGQEQETEEATAPEEAERIDEEVGEAEEAPAVVDPIADLRADLGWGGIDRSKLAPRANPSGRAAMAGMVPTSQQRVLDPEVDADSISYVQARGTEVGKYTERVYDIVNAAWYELDLSSDDKAMGIQGDVTIVFHVLRNGRVEDLSVLRSSGYAPLDEMALAAVPARLPRIPRAVEENVLLQQITFHYKNPLVNAPTRR